MRVHAFVFVAFILASAPAVAWAQRVEVHPGARPKSLMDQMVENKWVQYRVVSGRVVATAIASNMSHTQVSQGPSRNERTTLEVSGGAPTVKYELHSPSEDLQIELIAGKQFSARRTGKTAGVTTFEFDQPASGDLTLTVGAAPNRRTAKAPSVWRLAVAEEELCRQTIFPLLESLRPGWKLGSTTASIEEGLFRLASRGPADDRRQWDAWVDDLGSDKFSRRVVAQRRLFEAGPNAATFLEQLNPGRLDAEQRERVRDLIARFSRGSEDSVEQVTAWLASDPEIWLSLMNRADESRRRLAARQLSRCLDRPIDFDPAADAPTRGEQISRLRTRLQADLTPIPQEPTPEEPRPEKPAPEKPIPEVPTPEKPAPEQPPAKSTNAG